MSNLHIDPYEWAEEMFEYENCAECGRGAEGHDIIEFMGNWFARCKDAPPNRRDVSIPQPRPTREQ